MISKNSIINKHCKHKCILGHVGNVYWTEMTDVLWVSVNQQVIFASFESVTGILNNSMSLLNILVDIEIAVLYKEGY